MKKKEVSKKRPPIITVMGHVDHGKTTLIDYLRKSNIVDKEKGGITQGVRAFSIPYKDSFITFIDTPGHEAFSQMRERGSKLTDIILLIVSAEDSVKPQTKEVIKLSLENNIPMIVSINKIDLPNANSNKVKIDLSTNGVYVEGFGGDTVCVEISAKTGQGIDALLDMISLVYEMSDIKEVENFSEGTVLESYMNKQTGPESLVVVQSGEFKVGAFVGGDEFYGKIRALINDKEERVNIATSSMPVRIQGLDKVLKAGEIVKEYNSKDDYKEIIKKQEETVIVDDSEESALSIIDKLMSQAQDDNVKPKLNIVLKADTVGSIEAIESILAKNVNEDIELKFIKTGTGEISENDLDLAKSTKAIIIGFNIKLSTHVKTLAQRERVHIMLYDIIYELTDDIITAAESLIPAEEEVIIVGKAKVSEVFQLSNKTCVAGSIVKEGKILKNSKCYVERQGEKMIDAKITSIRHFKNEVKEAIKGMECGISIDSNFQFEVGDIVVCVRIEKG